MAGAGEGARHPAAVMLLRDHPVAPHLGVVPDPVKSQGGNREFIPR